MSHHSCRQHFLAVVGGLALLFVATRPAEAQTASAGSNSGRLHVTGGLDFPSVYVFRGFVREEDPALTLFPSADVGIALASGDGGIKRVGVNVGTWHSLQTGSRGSDGPSDKIHYEEDFYATLALGFGAGLGVDTTFTAYTSPNFMFNTVKEMSIKVSKAQKYAPYGIVAVEVGGSDAGQADGGVGTGTYLELGAGPSWPIGGSKVSLTVPVRVGLSLKNYYELSGEDHKFGYFDVGGQLAVPISKVSSNYGAWNLHGGVTVYTLGDATKDFNQGDKAKVVATVGIGVSY